MANEAAMGTITGEVFQPVRLHYRVLDDNALAQAFKKLRCVEHDPPRERWVWLYEHEARGLQFTHSYDDIKKELRPIIIGSFFQRPNDTLMLDLRSCERAILAVPFFDKHIPRGVAKVMEAEVANSLYSLDNPQLSPADVFDHQTSTSRDPEAEMKRLAELITKGSGIRARFNIMMKAVHSATEQPLPEVERIPVHYYEDGIDGFKLALTVRQIMAREHWSGNTAYTLSDAIREVTGSM